MTDISTYGPAPRKKRRTSPRTKQVCKNPAASEALRRKWQDPEFRAARLAGLARAAEGRRNGIGTRKGIPDGYRRPEAERLKAEAAEFAKKIVKKMIDSGDLPVTTTDEQKAAECLEAAIAIVRSPGEERNKIAALKIVLDFCKPKPVAKTELTVKNAEDWLAAVSAAADDE